MKVVYRAGGENKAIRCDSYEEFGDELVLYDAQDEFVASVPLGAVVAIQPEAV